MELELTDDQEIFAGATRKFLEESVPVAELRARRADPIAFDRDYWRQGAELGWTSLLASEADGGGSISDHELSDLGLLAFEFGRSAAPGPLVENNVVASAVSRLGTDEQRAQVLEGLLSGEELASWCFAEPAPNHALGTIDLTATKSGEGWVLNGIKQPVETADQASWLRLRGRQRIGGARDGRCWRQRG